MSAKFNPQDIIFNLIWFDFGFGFGIFSIVGSASKLLT
jgi:hypothetical protein